MKRSHVGALLMLVVGLSACATIVKGTTQLVTISSNVEGADIYLDGVKIGTTPFTGQIKKNAETLRVEMQGYRPETVSLSKTIEPMFFGNVIFGGTFGSTTDFASGAAYTYAPSSYQVELQEQGQSRIDYERQYDVRRFAMVYMDRIAADAAVGGGEYLSALASMIGTEDLTTIVDALSESRGDQLTFGRMAVALL